MKSLTSGSSSVAHIALLIRLLRSLCDPISSQFNLEHVECAHRKETLFKYYVSQADLVTSLYV